MTLYLVTGGAGFIGSHLVTALVARGDRVRVLDDLSTGRLDNLAHLDVGELASGAAVELVSGSIADAAVCARAAQGVAGVLHEAAQVSVPQSVEQPERSYEINVMGTLRVLEAARAAGARRVVMAASSAAYGDSNVLPLTEDLPPRPLSPYAAGKVAGEHLLKVWAECFGLRTACLRYFNIFGPRQADDSPYTGVIAIFARALLEGRAPTIFGDGEQTRDFTYVDNVVAANLAALEADLPPGAIINVGGGERISLNRLYDAIAEHLGSALRPSYAAARAGDVRDSLASLARAREMIGYAPSVSWKDGLAITLEWYRATIGAAG
jgi:UDP-glucose 4-epimerase